jgi:hypothetical protein
MKKERKTTIKKLDKVRSAFAALPLVELLNKGECNEIRTYPTRLVL